MTLRELVLYLDPFTFFKNVGAGTPQSQAEALRYNRRHRARLLAYAIRWGVIGAASLDAMLVLCGLAGDAPLLWIPIVGLEVGFTAAVCMLLISAATYVLLGLED